MSNEEKKQEAQAAAPPAPGITEEAYSELGAIVGAEYITRDPVMCQAYNGRGYGREAFWYQGVTQKPYCVVMPKSTQEVSRIVRLCYRYDIPYTSGSTYQAAAASAMFRTDFVMIDLQRMDKIVIDGKNMYAILEPGIIYAQFQAELTKRDMYFMAPGGGGQPSVVSNQMFQGQGVLCYRICPWPERRMNGAEWVTPEGEVVQCGIFMDNQEHAFWGQAPGPDLLGIFKGNTAWWGTLGILTKISTKVYPFQPEPLVPDGVQREAALNLPPRVRYQNYTLPNEDALKNAMREIGREQIGAAMNRVPAFWRTIGRSHSRQDFWDLWLKVTPEEVAKTHILRVLFVGYTSLKQLEYEMRVAEDIIVKKYGGVARRTKQTDDGTFQYSIVTGMWKPTGMYASEMVGMGAYRATWQINADEIEVTKNYIKGGVFFDQYGEHPWYAPFNLGRVIYSEHMAQVDCEKIDPANPRFDMNSVGGLLTFLESEVPKLLVKYGWANLFGNGHINSKLLLGPTMHNYHIWTQKIKSEFDPKDVCRKGLADHIDMIIAGAPMIITEDFKATAKQVAESGWKDAELADVGL